MARLFLDANVSFSAAYRSDTGLLKLWKLREVVLCSFRYALEEARINLNHEVQRTRLVRLAGKVQLFDAGKHELPEGVWLPEKDRAVARDMRLNAAREGLRAPVQVLDGNYRLMSGTCAWWDEVKQ